MLKVIKNTDYYQVVTVDDIQMFTPDDLVNIKLPNDIDHRKGTIINGRMPIWVFCHISHLCHPSLWVATNDPRLGGAVVCQTHTSTKNLGDIIILQD
jgi:CRISPR-associated protein Csx3